MRTKKDRRNEIWIELRRPVDAQHAEEITSLASNVLQRLAGKQERGFVWDEKEGRWCWSSPMGSEILSDNGMWFNLDYLGRPIPPEENVPAFWVQTNSPDGSCWNDSTGFPHIPGDTISRDKALEKARSHVKWLCETRKQSARIVTKTITVID